MGRGPLEVIPAHSVNQISSPFWVDDDATQVSAQPAFATSGSIDGCLKFGNAEPAERSGAAPKLAGELTKRLDRLVLIIKDFE